MTFPDWQWMIRMFEFAHTYAARVVSICDVLDGYDYVPDVTRNIS